MGLSVSDCVRLVETLRDSVEVTRLDDPGYWGREITDERYLLLSTR